MGWAWVTAFTYLFCGGAHLTTISFLRYSESGEGGCSQLKGAWSLAVADSRPNEGRELWIGVYLQRLVVWAHYNCWFSRPNPSRMQEEKMIEFLFSSSTNSEGLSRRKMRSLGRHRSQGCWSSLMMSRASSCSLVVVAVFAVGGCVVGTSTLKSGGTNDQRGSSGRKDLIGQCEQNQ